MGWGAGRSDAKMVDAMVGAVRDPFDNCHMGITAENVAKRWEISREDQDALAVESHRRAANAVNSGYFKEQILPIEVKIKGGTRLFDTDENVRGGTTIEKLSRLR